MWSTLLPESQHPFQDRIMLCCSGFSLLLNPHSSTLNPYPPHYKAAFAFFCIPYSHTYRRASQQAYSFPEEINGLTLFRVLTLTKRLRCHLSTESTNVREGYSRIPNQDSVLFSPSLTASLSCSG